ncbi:MAG: HD domain-containing phosphohydrolase [Candidatus Omnitrophota bacterium]
MIRIADIIGGSSEEDKEKKEKERQEKQKEPTPPPNVELIKNQTQFSSLVPPTPLEKQEPSLLELSKSMLDRVKLEDPKESKVLYETIINSLQEVCKDLVLNQGIELDSLNNSLNSLIDQIALGNEQFLVLVNNPCPPKYIFPHMVNVAVLSIFLGRQVGLNKSRLLELALGALLHDVGLLQFEEIIYAARKITNEEYEQVKRHPVLGAKLLEKQKGISKNILSIVSGHHERSDGSGYPLGLKADKIDESTQIVCLANAYDSLIHKRPFRERLLNEQAVKLLVERKASFNSRLLKFFIEAISIYPVGCWVKLSSGDIAKVVGINKSSLLKPLVQLYFDKHEKRLETEKIVDLSKQPNLYVKEQVLDEMIELKLKV